jgi:hypothetical protein
VTHRHTDLLLDPDLQGGIDACCTAQMKVLREAGEDQQL